jgi:glucose 1-dehydrogenase
MSHEVLPGQRALVTGANSGIGEGVAIALGKAGAKVVVNYISNEERANKVVETIKSNGSDALAIRADVSKEDQVQAMFKQMIDTWGSIDILVANAGVQRDADFTAMTLEQWQFVIDVNLTGQFLCCREAAREFTRRDIDPELSCSAGKIICMSSVHEVIPWAGHVNYATSKGGVNMMMQSIAQEMAAKKIRVNSISPGAIATPINTSAWNTPEAETELLKLIPYQRVGKPKDIARAAVWLASDDSDYITGTSIFVDGGMTLYPGFREGG